MASTASVTDNFNDNSLNVTTWSSYGSIAETNQRLEISVTGATPDYHGIYTTATNYDMTGSYAFARLVDAGNQAWNSLEVELQVLRNGGGANRLFWIISQNFIQAWKTVASTTTNIGSNVAYNSTNHKWFRIREASGTTYWEYASQAQYEADNWQTHHSEANPIVVTSMAMELDAGNYSAESGTTTPKWDDFNIVYTPPASSGRKRLSLLGVS